VISIARWYGHESSNTPVGYSSDAFFVHLYSPVDQLSASYLCRGSMIHLPIAMTLMPRISFHILMAHAAGHLGGRGLKPHVFQWSGRFRRKLLDRAQNDLYWLLQVVAGRRRKDVTIVDRPFENGDPLDHMGNQQIAIDRATEVPAS
jgi:hypothetical protein